MKATTELPTSEWEHSHALNEGDELEDTHTGERFTVREVHDDGSVTLYEHEWDATETFEEREINGALADGNFERMDGKSHELATF